MTSAVGRVTSPLRRRPPRERVLERVQRTHESAAQLMVPDESRPDDFDVEQPFPWVPALVFALCGYAYTLVARVSPVVGSSIPYVNAAVLLCALGAGIAGIGLKRFDTVAAASNKPKAADAAK